MPRKRDLDPAIWRSDQFLSLPSDTARLCFIALISVADDLGIGRISDLKRYTSIHKSDVLAVAESGLCVLYLMEDGMDDVFLYLLPKWCKYQYVNRPTKSSTPLPADWKDYVPSSFRDRYRERPILDRPSFRLFSTVTRPASEDDVRLVVRAIGSDVIQFKRGKAGPGFSHVRADIGVSPTVGTGDTATLAEPSESVDSGDGPPDGVGDSPRHSGIIHATHAPLRESHENLTERHGAPSPSPSPSPDSCSSTKNSDFEDEIALWNGIAKEFGLPAVRKLNHRERSSLKAMIGECDGNGHLERAFRCAARAYARLDGKKYGLKNLIRASNRGSWIDAARLLAAEVEAGKDDDWWNALPPELRRES